MEQGFTLFSQASAKAKKCNEAKRKLSDCLPLLAGVAITLIMVWYTWRSFAVEGSGESAVSANGRAYLHSNHSRGGGGDEDEDDIFPLPESNDSSIEGFVYTGLPPYYRLGKLMDDWDQQRELWLKKHPEMQNYTRDGRPRLFMLTGSQPAGCKLGSRGDYLLLRSFKNKVDYCRLHDIEMFYNTALLDKKMDSFWSKLPLVRATMEAHPEAEWLWWVDADVVITDMEFDIPLEAYKEYNLVVPGWESEVFGKKNAMGLNAGSFLIRNCAWTMKFLDRWASMGPKGKIRDFAGKLQSARLTNRGPADNPGDDQSALIFFMVEEKSVWGSKILVEDKYNLNGYWVDLVGGMEALERAEAADLAKKAAVSAKKEAEDAEKEAGLGKKEADLAANLPTVEWETLAVERKRRSPELPKRSFVTHFAGCQPCTGNHNPAFKEQECRRNMERALNLGDNQVLRAFGYRHVSIDLLEVQPLP